VAIHQQLSESGVLEVVIDIPPVNAVDIGHLEELTEILEGVAARPEVHVVLLRGEGRGFIGGGDVKEVQRLEGFAGILGQARGSLACSLAVHECAVPVIAAVHNYCIGLGVLVAGACDGVLASRGTVFVLAEVDNGATSGAVQALGLMPEKRLRVAMFTCAPVPAEELHGYGTGAAVVDEEELLPAARAMAETIATKSPTVVRATKLAINGTSGRQIRERYRQELSYTYELNMLGAARDARETFVSGSRKGYLSEQ